MPDTFNEACQLVAMEIAELLMKKQADYGHRNILDFGEFGVLVRLNDKVARLKNLINKEATNEPKLDSWRDIAGYALIAIMLERGWFELPLKRDVIPPR
jgi:hypothetical protein